MIRASILLGFAVTLVLGCTSDVADRRQPLPCHPDAYYAPPLSAPYIAEGVRVPTPAGHVLVGTLTYPLRGPTRHPAVVLVSGSHPQIRDMVGDMSEPIVRYQPFRQIADTLSRRGIAVLRLDDRGTGCSGGGPVSDVNTSARAGDTRAALTFLRGQTNIDPRRLGVVGISEGATIAIMIAATDPNLGAVVTMAGSAGPGWQVWAYQTGYKISLGEEMNRAQKKRWRAGEDPQNILNERVGEARDHVRAGKANAWWTYFFNYDPLTAAKKVASPVLILHGDRDSNVPVSHAHKLAAAIRNAGNTDVTVTIYPDHNHLFLPDKHGGFRRYKDLLVRTNQVPAYILDHIGNWLVQRLKED